MSADAKEQTPETKKAGEGLDQLTSFKSELDTKLAAVQEQLKALNDSFSQAANAKAPPPQREEIDDSDVFDAKTLNRKVTQTADTIAREILAEERRKNATIYEMSREYPEIQSDRALQQEILSAQKTLPKGLQDTAEGYEMAVLKAVAKQGLVAKSKRKEASSDDDFSVGGSRSVGSSAKRSSSRKVSDATMTAAELLRGRALTDDEKKGLEQAVNRDTYNRYR